MQTTTSNALDIVPCIFGKECSGRHDAIYTHTRVNGAMFTGLVAKYMPTVLGGNGHSPTQKNRRTQVQGHVASALGPRPLRSAAVFHIVHRDRLDFTALYGWELDQLGISELVPSTIQVFDPAVENFSAAWKPAFDMQFNVQNLEAVLIRGVSKTSFPLQYVVDMASGMNAALKAIERSTDHDMIHLFAHHFPQCHQPGVDAFLAAILMWSEVSDEQKSHYAALGRTTAGQWKSLLAASHQRTSTPA
ncbi:hypothetical protein BKA62DRAFT_673698 [Auriculariales sp. MPI-PUGE-AT-0066]|nr:hypothetical protein BKA62DRAFT_673698 [Auriculariales sp. MPI-PUGE-AT-0066]